jgi:predicted extracellular nuclease
MHLSGPLTRRRASLSFGLVASLLALLMAQFGFISSISTQAAQANLTAGAAIPLAGSGSVNLTTIGIPVTETFDSLVNTGVTATTGLPNGWYFIESGSGDSSYRISDGSATNGDTYSFGTTSTTDRAFGALASNSVTSTLGVQFTNSTSATLGSLTISYTGEEWRFGGRTAPILPDELDFQYSTDATSLTTGTWTAVPALNFISPDLTGGAGARNGNAAGERTLLSSTISGLNIANGTTFWLRWQDPNIGGSDDGLGADDFSLIPVAAGPTDTPTITLTPTVTETPGGPTATVTSTATQTGTPTITPTLPAGTTIMQIQGQAHLSPLNSQPVTNVFGIVTAKKTNGFYMQDPLGDGNTATSDAIFVFTSTAPAVTVGDLVRVNGSVTEFRVAGSATNLTTTEIGSPTVVVVSSGNPLPLPVVLGIGGRMPPTQVIEDDATGNVETSGVFDPDTDGIDFYESLEAMRLQVNNPVASGPSNSFNEISVLPDDGAWASPRTPRGGIIVQANDFNPERIIIDDALPGITIPNVNVGDHFSTCIGVLDYSFGNFMLELTQSPSATAGGIAREVTTPQGPNEIAVSNFNVENLSPLDGITSTKVISLASEIVDNLKAPDLLSLQEIQDNTGPTDNGVVDASQTYAMLIQAIQTAGGPTYTYRQIDPVNDQDGGQPGGNIRTGFLFRTDRGLSFVDRPGGTSTAAVSVTGTAGNPQLSFSPGRIAPSDPAWNSSRKPLAGEFMFNGHHLFVIGNHFNSKGGDQPLFGPNQPPVRSSEVQRAQQATLVNNFIDSIMTLDPNANVVVLGDLNDFDFSNTVLTLRGVIPDNNVVLHDLLETLPVNERYSYVFEGNSQALDHILVSNHIFNSVPFVYDPVHVNAEFSPQASDHDPEVVRLLLPVGGTTPTTTATVTQTSVPPTVTNTVTQTSVPPTVTNTVTQTSVPPTVTNTVTQTSEPPTVTATRTSTAVIPTVTLTLTVVPPTITVTVVPPTVTRTATATATVTRTATVTATACPTFNFSDVAPSDYFYVPVQYLACHGVIGGYADGTFRPYNNTTRGQMAKIVILGYSLPLTTPAAGGQTFQDVAPGSTFFAYIETLAARQIGSGYACGGVNPQSGTPEPCVTPTNRPYFRPGNDITRGQLVKLVVIAASQQLGWDILNPATPSFSDVPSGSTFYEYIETAVCHQVLGGYADGTFRPNNNAFRGQIAKIVYNAITGNVPGCVNPTVTATPTP